LSFAAALNMPLRVNGYGGRICTRGFNKLTEKKFDGKLQDVSVEWADLTADDSYA